MAQSTGFSLESTVRLRAEAFAHVRHHNSMILNIATGIEQLDAALMSATERSIDDQQQLINAARRLVSLLADGSAVQV